MGVVGVLGALELGRTAAEERGVVPCRASSGAPRGRFGRSLAGDSGLGVAPARSRGVGRPVAAVAGESERGEAGEVHSGGEQGDIG
jgi:hypothetical protein